MPCGFHVLQKTPGLMVSPASLWTLRALDGVVEMVTELDVVSKLGLNPLRYFFE